MSQFLEIFVNILIVLVMLGVLVSIHEAGHLAAAKIFKVYCFEYSIGMGPKIFSTKRKKGETKFSIRALPLGGYVSMYSGEEELSEDDLPEGMEALPPRERSLAGISVWKKCVILVAGVTLNFLLGLVLIYIGDSACPVYYYGRTGIVENETMLTVDLDASYSMSTLEYIKEHGEEEYLPKDYVVSLPSINISGTEINIISDFAHIYNTSDVMIEDGKTFVACYVPATLVDPHGLGGSIYLFPAAENPTVPAELANLGITNLPVLYDQDGKLLTHSFASYTDGVYLQFDATLVPKQERKSSSTWNAHKLDLPMKLTVKNGALTNNDLEVLVIKEWNSFPESWRQWAKDVPTACTAVVKGFASLFTPGGWKNISGIVGITAAMPQIKAAGGARMVFFYAGMISINLAFFNLLPIPGLDGWQLIVTVIEKATKKKVPPKARTIVTVIGFSLLIALMLFVTVKDIIGLF